VRLLCGERGGLCQRLGVFCQRGFRQRELGVEATEGEGEFCDCVPRGRGESGWVGVVAQNPELGGEKRIFRLELRYALGVCGSIERMALQFYGRGVGFVLSYCTVSITVYNFIKYNAHLEASN
jgi:hypothetical protein